MSESDGKTGTPSNTPATAAGPSTSNGASTSPPTQPRSKRSKADSAPPSSPNPRSASPPPLFPELLQPTHFQVEFSTLECPVCLQVPKGAILACPQGHPICSRCFMKLRVPPGDDSEYILCPVGRCPFDQDPTRMRILETLVDQSGYRFSCRYEEVGCDVMEPKSRIDIHEQRCGYRNIKCFADQHGDPCDGASRQNLTSHIQECHPVPFDTISLCSIHRAETLIMSDTAFTGGPMLDFYCCIVKGPSFVQVVARADLEDPRFEGVHVELKVMVSGRHPLWYRGPFLDVETPQFEVLRKWGPGVRVPYSDIEEIGSGETKMSIQGKLFMQK